MRRRESDVWEEVVSNGAKQVGLIQRDALIILENP
jgi:hypothetical protein